MLSTLSTAYNIIFFKPLLNGLVLLVDFLPFHDIGIAIVILTLAVKFMLFPLAHKSTILQVRMRQIEPDIRGIKEKFKNNSGERAKKTMELYKKHGINPLSGFITLLIQIPIIFALYKVFLSGANFDVANLYSSISSPESINTTFLGFIDMTKRSYFLAFLAAISQFFQMKLAMPPAQKSNQTDSFKDNFARSMNIQMRYIMPFFIFFIGLKFSSAIALYWTTMNIFAIVHEAIVRKKAEKIYGTANKNGKIASGGGFRQADH